MASGSRDATIKIWNLSDGKIDRTLIGHTRGIWCLKFITKFLLCSGSYDSTIKIWNLKDGICSKTLYSHTGPVWSIVKSDYFLVSASQDRTVAIMQFILKFINLLIIFQKAIIWNLYDCEIANRLVAHKGAVFCVDATNDLVVTGSSDKVLFDRVNKF